MRQKAAAMTVPTTGVPDIGSRERTLIGYPPANRFLDEPVGRPPVIDADGYAWIYRPPRTDRSLRVLEESRWERQALIVVGRRCIPDPAIDGDWTDVVAAGPARLANPDDDLSMVYLHYPSGWHQFTPIGTPVRVPAPRTRP
ncbi:hypothetical protein [Prescottella subtropica]|uniref:hypothetical protein n=1 Tax=Prescottella subtropica TaxID=2545757 RepID=UPI0010F736CB|nr:hypothetical protein [Prescottella subtropica]